MRFVLIAMPQNKQIKLGFSKYGLTLFLSYAYHVVLVGQMSTVYREVHRLHGTGHVLEVLEATGRCALCELYLSDLQS